MEHRYNLRRAGKLFKALSKERLSQLASARLLLPDDDLTDLSSGRETSPIQEFPAWFADTSKPLVSSLDVLEDVLESSRIERSSEQEQAIERKKNIEALKNLFQPVLDELREIHAETQKTKWAVRVIAFLLAVIVLFGLKIVWR